MSTLANRPTHYPNSGSFDAQTTVTEALQRQKFLELELLPNITALPTR